MKRFRMTNEVTKHITEFTEEDAPPWLTSKNQVPGSTMDSSWFWKGYVLTLEIGGVVLTDFNAIERIE